MAAAAPGDMIAVDGNATYSAVRWTKSGTAAQPIQIVGIAAAQVRPKIQGGTNTVEVEANYVVVEGFDISGGSSRCFYHHGDHVTLRDSVVHDCPLQGILGADTDSGSFLLEYVEVHHCGSGDQQSSDLHGHRRGGASGQRVPDAVLLRSRRERRQQRQVARRAQRDLLQLDRGGAVPRAGADRPRPRRRAQRLDGGPGARGLGRRRQRAAQDGDVIRGAHRR